MCRTGDRNEKWARSVGLQPVQKTLSFLIRTFISNNCLAIYLATVVSGFLGPDGEVSISNAGHPPPLIITGRNHQEVRATGVPIGMFCESQFSSSRFTLGTDDTLLIYTDGLTEARNGNGEEYGTRVEDVARRAAKLPIADAVQAIIFDQQQFRGDSPNADDLTILAIRRT